LKSFLKNNALILVLYLIALTVALVLILSHNKTDLHLLINKSVGYPFIDLFFYYITYLGDGNMAIVILLLVIIYNIRIGIYCTVVCIIASLSSVGLKHFFFDDVNRPFFIFTYFEHIQLKLVDGVQLYIHNSFPSGHATQAFAIFMSLAFCLSNQKIKLLLLLLALCTAFSRVYLSQHWLQDVTAGSLVGIFFSMLFYFLLYKYPGLNKFNRSFFRGKKN